MAAKASELSDETQRDVFLFSYVLLMMKGSEIVHGEKEGQLQAHKKI